MADEVHKNYNFSRSFCYFVCSYIAGILRRDYNKDSFDLSDIGVHNGIVRPFFYLFLFKVLISSLCRSMTGV